MNVRKIALNNNTNQSNYCKSNQNVSFKGFTSEVTQKTLQDLITKKDCNIKIKSWLETLEKLESIFKKDDIINLKISQTEDDPTIIRAIIGFSKKTRESNPGLEGLEDSVNVSLLKGLTEFKKMIKEKVDFLNLEDKLLKRLAQL